MNPISDLILAKKQPRYLLLAKNLIDEITGGLYPIGSLLPTESVLSTRHDVSRHTVREALRQIQEMGLVSRQQGVGTRVEAATPADPFKQSLNSIQDIQQYAGDTRLRDIVFDSVVADESLAGLLRCQAGQNFLSIEASRVLVVSKDAPPIAWTKIYIIDAYAGIRDYVSDYKGAVGNLIEEQYGERISEVAQEISAISLPKDLAKRLECKPGKPGLRVQRWYTGRDDRIFLVALAVHFADEYKVSMRFLREGY